MDGVELSTMFDMSTSRPWPINRETSRVGRASTASLTHSRRLALSLRAMAPFFPALVALVNRDPLLIPYGMYT
jgi:hypothetical protein